MRRFRRHLVDVYGILRKARCPERLIQSPVPAPVEAALAVLQAGCAACRGFSCLGGEDHAYLDERTMAWAWPGPGPELTERGVIAEYVAQIAPFVVSGILSASDRATGDHLATAARRRDSFCTPLREYLRGGVFDGNGCGGWGAGLGWRSDGAASVGGAARGECARLRDACCRRREHTGRGRL